MSRVLVVVLLGVVASFKPMLKKHSHNSGLAQIDVDGKSKLELEAKLASIEAELRDLDNDDEYNAGVDERKDHHIQSKQASKLLLEDQLCGCSGYVSTENAGGHGGGSECSSYDMVGGVKKYWCYVNEGSCDDGVPSEALAQERQDWSYMACGMKYYNMYNFEEVKSCGLMSKVMYHPSLPDYLLAKMCEHAGGTALFRCSQVQCTTKQFSQRHRDRIQKILQISYGSPTHFEACERRGNADAIDQRQHSKWCTDLGTDTDACTNSYTISGDVLKSCYVEPKVTWSSSVELVQPSALYGDARAYPTPGTPLNRAVLDFSMECKPSQPYDPSCNLQWNQSEACDIFHRGYNARTDYEKSWSIFTEPKQWCNNIKREKNCYTPSQHQYWVGDDQDNFWACYWQPVDGGVDSNGKKIEKGCRGAQFKKSDCH